MPRKALSPDLDNGRISIDCFHAALRTRKGNISLVTGKPYPSVISNDPYEVDDALAEEELKQEDPFFQGQFDHV